MSTFVSTAPQQRRPKKRLLFTPSEEHLLPAGLAGVPKPVVKANEAAGEALRRMHSAKATLDLAAGELEAAPEFDRNAAVVAMQAGEPVPDRIEPLRQVAYDEAKRAYDAAHDATCRLVLELYDQLEAHLPAYTEARLKAADEAASPLTGGVNAIIDALDRFRSEAWMAREAVEFYNQPAYTKLKPPADTSTRTMVEKAAARDAKRVNRNAPVERKVPALLAALAEELALEVEKAHGRIPARQRTTTSASKVADGRPGNPRDAVLAIFDEKRGAAA